MLHIESLIESETEIYPTIIENDKISASENVLSLAKIQDAGQNTEKKETPDETEKNTDEDSDVLRVPSIRTSQPQIEHMSDETRQNINISIESEIEEYLREDVTNPMVELEENALKDEEIPSHADAVHKNQKNLEEIPETIYAPYAENETYEQEPDNKEIGDAKHNIEENTSSIASINTDDDHVFSVFDETSIMKHVVNETHSVEYSHAPKNEKAFQENETEHSFNKNDDTIFSSATINSLDSRNDKEECIQNNENTDTYEDNESISLEHTDFIPDEGMQKDTKKSIEKKNKIYILSTEITSNEALKSKSPQKANYTHSSESTNITIKNNSHEYKYSKEIPPHTEKETYSAQVQEDIEIETASLDEEDMTDIEAYVDSNDTLTQKERDLMHKEEIAAIPSELADHNTESSQHEDIEIETASLDEEDMTNIEAYVDSNDTLTQKERDLMHKEETAAIPSELADHNTESSQHEDIEIETASLDEEDMTDIEAYVDSNDTLTQKERDLMHKEEIAAIPSELADHNTESSQHEDIEIETASLDEEDMTDIEAYVDSNDILTQKERDLMHKEETAAIPSELADHNTESSQHEDIEIETASLNEEDMTNIEAYIDSNDTLTQKERDLVHKEETPSLKITEEAQDSQNHVVKEQCLNIEASLIHLEVRLRKILNLSENVKKMELFTTAEDFLYVSRDTWDKISKEQKNALRIICNAVEKHFQDTVRYSHFMQDDAYLCYKTLQQSLYLQ